jgi:hypothetical protein
MKIFRMNDCDWMIGASLEECTAEYIENYSDADTIDDDACEVTGEALDRLRFRICSDDGQDESTRTFRQQISIEIAEGGVFPRLFASTEE